VSAALWLELRCRLRQVQQATFCCHLLLLLLPLLMAISTLVP
jgi:hypothetical protein